MGRQSTLWGSVLLLLWLSASYCEGGAPDFSSLALVDEGALLEGLYDSECSAAEASVENSFAYGPGYEVAYAGDQMSYSVKAVGSDGALVASPDWVVSYDNSTVEDMGSEAVDCATTKFFYVCSGETVTISVQLRGSEISNSPRTLPCSTPPSSPLPTLCPASDCPACDDTDSSDGWVWTLVAVSVVEAVVIALCAVLAAPLVFHMVRDIGFRDIIRDRILMREFNTPIYSAINANDEDDFGWEYGQ